MVKIHISATEQHLKESDKYEDVMNSRKRKGRETYNKTESNNFRNLFWEITRNKLVRSQKFCKTN
jgi:hypothetical protein